MEGESHDILYYYVFMDLYQLCNAWIYQYYIIMFSRSYVNCTGPGFINIIFLCFPGAMLTAQGMDLSILYFLCFPGAMLTAQGLDLLYVMFSRSYVNCTGPGFSLHSHIVMPYISHYGTKDQVDKFIPDMISGQRIGAIAMTEPGAGR